jgi:hypothetical protein
VVTDVARNTDDQLPALQLEHGEIPVAEYVPAGQNDEQAVTLVDPDVTVERPSAQRVQVVGETAPTAAE